MEGTLSRQLSRAEGGQDDRQDAGSEWSGARWVSPDGWGPGPAPAGRGGCGRRLGPGLALQCPPLPALPTPPPQPL